MRKLLLLAAALGTAVFGAGCSRVVVIEAEMPPLLPVPRTVRTVAVSPFAWDERTAPADRAADVAALLAEELARAQRYTLVKSSDDAQLVLSGEALCRVTRTTVRLPGELDPKATAELVAADVSIAFVATAGRTLRLFRVVERPQAEARPHRGFDRQKLAALLRACVRAFAADITPQRVPVKLVRPGWFGSARTRRGIDLIATNPAEAIRELAAAVEASPNDAAAANALALCSEVAGNLDRALHGYRCAAALDPRDAYRENAERVFRLLQHRRDIERAAAESQGGPR